MGTLTNNNMTDLHTTVVYITSNAYFAVTMVAVSSLLRNISLENTYEIIVISDETENEDQQNMIALAHSYPNVTIRFLNPLKNKKLKNPSDIFNIDWYNLALPWLLPKYDKVVRLESDTIVRGDIAELFCQRLEDNDYAAGVIYSPSLKERKSKDGILDTGVLLLSLENMRKSLNLPLIEGQKGDGCSKYYEAVMRKVFDHHLVQLPPMWCVCPNDYFQTRTMEEIRKDTRIIHYRRQKPWDNPVMVLAEDWWNVARSNAYYEELIRRMCFQSQPESQFRRFINRLFPKGSRRREWIKRIRNSFKLMLSRQRKGD